ncbi:MAG: sugar ABC transporter permease [Chloroflexota bacterium]|nr:sugar ABC transporter permease [Chloroflexota bacterium]
MTSSAGLAESSLRTPRRYGSLRRREAIMGYVFAAPWILGFVFFIAGPMLASIILSFTNWDLLSPIRFVGFGNYNKLLFNDPLLYQSLKVTSIYAFVSVPLQVALGLVLAILLNQKIKALSFFRSIYYLPSVIGGISVAIMWRWILGTQFGMVNTLLSYAGIEGPAWLGDPQWVLVSFIIMSLWGTGGAMLIYLGGLQGIPSELYEAADVDGAGPIPKFLRITVPMMTPVIFFNMIIGIIHALQEFVAPFVMTGGGPHNSSLFLVLYLYRNAFQMFQMGYASAIAWVLFIYIMILTALVVRSSAVWVYYEGSAKGR